MLRFQEQNEFGRSWKRYSERELTFFIWTDLSTEFRSFQGTALKVWLKIQICVGALLLHCFIWKKYQWKSKHFSTSSGRLYEKMHVQKIQFPVKRDEEKSSIYSEKFCMAKEYHQTFAKFPILMFVHIQQAQPHCDCFGHRGVEMIDKQITSGFRFTTCRNNSSLSFLVWLFNL